MANHSRKTTIPHKDILYIAAIVGALLLVALVLTLLGSGVEGEGWHWTPRDFVFAGVMFSGTGLALDFAARKLRNPTYRIIALAGIILMFLLIWVQLAVGIFG